MQSENNKKPFVPRTVAVKSLYEENVRLQKLCVAHRRQIRGMQRTVEYLRTELAAFTLLRTALKDMKKIFVAPTKTVEVTDAVGN